MICKYVSIGYWLDNLYTADGASVMTQLSELWGHLSDSEKQEWTDKADNAYITTPVQKAKAIQELTLAIEQNVL